VSSLQSRLHYRIGSTSRHGAKRAVHIHHRYAAAKAL
jgi:hypothetical protein